MAPTSQDPQASRVCLGGTAPQDFLDLRDPQALLEERVLQEERARKEPLATQEPLDPRAARETQALWVLPGRMALQEPLGPLDPQDPQDPQDLPGPLDKDSLRDLMTWKALEPPSGQQPEAPQSSRDHLAFQDSREILVCLGLLETKGKLEQMAPAGSLASQAVKAQLGPWDPKERKGVREKKVTQGRTAWASLASPGPQDPRAPWSMCRNRTEHWPVCQVLRAGRALQASLDLLGQRATRAPKAHRAPRDPRVRKGSQVASLALTAEPWVLCRREPRVSLASVDPRDHMDGLGTREKSAFLDGRVALE